jgi:hypothetical protein
MTIDRSRLRRRLQPARQLLRPARASTGRWSISTSVCSTPRVKRSAWADEAREQGEELVLAKDGKSITVDFRQADLMKDLEWVLGWQPDLVTAAALFDLDLETLDRALRRSARKPAPAALHRADL